jgi:hypothetical protein
VRKLLALVVALGGILIVTTASATGGRSATLAASTSKVLYGHLVSLSGQISSRRSGEHVAILAQPYADPAMGRLTTITTRADGRWSYRARPETATSFRARWGSTESRTVTVGVRPAVSVRVLEDGSILARVRGGHSFAGRWIKLQRRLASGQWQTLRQHQLDAVSSARFAVPLRAGSGSLRIAMSVNQAGAGYLGTLSHTLVYHAYSLTLSPSSFRVPYGNSTLLSGRLMNAHAGQVIAIDAWPYGASAPTRIGTALTGESGRWSYRARPTIQTAYQAHWGPIESSPRIVVGVRPAVSIQELGNGHVVTRVTAGRSMRGRVIKLQNWMPNTGWQTVETKHLDAHSTAIFAIPFPTLAIRFRMSVNQAGSGYLDTASHLLIYRLF